VASDFPQELWRALRGWWREESRDQSSLGRTSLLVQKLWEFLRESTPAQRRQRYGDMEYDWENRVNTSGGTVGWRERLLGLFHSPYQPTEPVLFREMMASLPIEFEQFTFVDVGSGKGRTLLMASDYPFRRIVGVELIAELHRDAEENIREYRSPGQCCRQIECVLADARDYEFPVEPLVLYLFNPLPEHSLLQVLLRLKKSLEIAPRAVWLIYHNPLLENALRASGFLAAAGGTPQYSVYRTHTPDRTIGRP
jgi:SAM-dependent methyltransferase